MWFCWASKVFSSGRFLFRPLDACPLDRKYLQFSKSTSGGFPTGYTIQDRIVTTIQDSAVKLSTLFPNTICYSLRIESEKWVAPSSSSPSLPAVPQFRRIFYFVIITASIEGPRVFSLPTHDPNRVGVSWAPDPIKMLITSSNHVS